MKRFPRSTLSAALLAAVSFAPSASRADSGKSFLETIGISLAVGTVLGASTLPFYDQPGKHLSNMGIGALTGALVGIGIGTYQKITGPSPDMAAFGSRGEARQLSGQSAEHRIYDDSFSNLPTSQGIHPRIYQAKLWLPLVSLNW